MPDLFILYTICEMNFIQDRADLLEQYHNQTKVHLITQKIIQFSEAMSNLPAN